MSTVRRLYLYAVAFVSLETALWGSIGLVSAAFNQELSQEAGQMAGGLSLILVGAPVFVLHWWLAQRMAAQSLEERFSRLRAVFLYGVLLATLLPAAQNALLLVNRMLGEFLREPSLNLIASSDQPWIDNAIRISLNALVAAYFFLVLRGCWRHHRNLENDRPELAGSALVETRRLYRYAWLLYGLAFAVTGAQQLIRFVLELALGTPVGHLLANGLALLVAGVPAWLLARGAVRGSLHDRQEIQSTSRLSVLYLLAFLSLWGLLAAIQGVLEITLLALITRPASLPDLLSQATGPIALAVPMAVVWQHYGRGLQNEIRPVSEPQEAASDLPTIPSAQAARLRAVLDGRQRARLRRVYTYVLALTGLVAFAIALLSLAAIGIELATSPLAVWRGVLDAETARALAILAVGLPLWFFSWRAMQREAAGEDEAGDHARRSLVRKSYLYSVLFASVIGVMASAGTILYQLLGQRLGSASPDEQTILQGLRLLVLFAVLLAYHGWVLRLDQRRAERSLARRHAQFPVLILAPLDGAGEAVQFSAGRAPAEIHGFSAAIVAALQHTAPALPVAVHPFHLGVPDESLSAARAVILPADLVAHPSEALRLWLQGFKGERFVIPTPAAGWQWVAGSGRPLPSLAAQAALSVRRMAEGEGPLTPGDSPPWMPLVYLAAGLFVLEGLLLAFILISNFLP